MYSKRAIVVYTHKDCPGGDRAISYFHNHGIPVQVKDIVLEPESFDEFQKHGCFATPVIMIDGRKFTGFEEEDIEPLIG